MTDQEPRAVFPDSRPAVLWRETSGTDPVLHARCQQCGRVIGEVYETSGGLLLRFFTPVMALKTTIGGDKEMVEEFVAESPRYTEVEWIGEADGGGQTLRRRLPDSGGTVCLVDDDDYWINGAKWGCVRHGLTSIDRAALRDSLRRGEQDFMVSVTRL
jgi:hypothetical protein